MEIQQQHFSARMHSSNDQHPKNANFNFTNLTAMRRREPTELHSQGCPFPLKDECWIEVGASHASPKYDESKQASINMRMNIMTRPIIDPYEQHDDQTEPCRSQNRTRHRNNEQRLGCCWRRHRRVAQRLGWPRRRRYIYLETNTKIAMTDALVREDWEQI